MFPQFKVLMPIAYSTQKQNTMGIYLINTTEHATIPHAIKVYQCPTNDWRLKCANY